jgi:hypothetical protein
VLADRFKVRIEMKQIGARQEAGRIGGLGPCGRELCCATWLTGFVSVGTAAARFQDLSLNPQKLAGQCAKLKCCMNYEVDQYVESLRRLPSREITLQTQDAEYFFFKADILAHRITYSTDKKFLANEQTISARRAFEVMQMNKNGQKPASLVEESHEPEPVSSDLIEQESINRFDSRNKKNGKKGGKKKHASAGNGNGGNENSRQGNNGKDRGNNNGGGRNRGNRHNGGNGANGGNPNGKDRSGGNNPGNSSN